MKVKTSVLEGLALDWAVAKTQGFVCKSSFQIPWYSTDWSQGGKLIMENVGLIERDAEEHSEPDEPWYAESGVFWGIGPTPLIAACRTVVAAKLGDEVDVPEELLS